MLLLPVSLLAAGAAAAYATLVLGGARIRRGRSLRGDGADKSNRGNRGIGEGILGFCGGVEELIGGMGHYIIRCN